MLKIGVESDVEKAEEEAKLAVHCLLLLVYEELLLFASACGNYNHNFNNFGFSIPGVEVVTRKKEKTTTLISISCLILFGLIYIIVWLIGMEKKLDFILFFVLLKLLES